MREHLYGISTIGLIGYFASLFFIGTLAQLDIRRTLNAPGVVYVEYFYFVLYSILLLQTINAVAFTVSDIPRMKLGSPSPIDTVSPSAVNSASWYCCSAQAMA